MEFREFTCRNDIGRALFECVARVCEALVEASEVETEYPVASLLVLFCNEKSTLG